MCRMHARKNQQLYEQHLLLVVALGLDLNYVDLIHLGGGHQDRGLDEQPTGKVRSEWNTLIMMENKQIISHLCEGLPSSSVSSPSFTGSLRFRDNQLKLRLQAILITFSLGEPKSTPSWQRSSRSSIEIPQRWRKTSLIDYIESLELNE